MKLKQYKKSLNKPLRKCTLCLLRRNNQVLLAMKKRGFGVGRWNGIGGKQKENETIEETVIRETQEEIGVIPKKVSQIATLNFYFPTIPMEKDWNQQVLVYFVDEWEGEPTESEEMAPSWFDFKDIPFDSMWQDDIHWLPKALKGSLLTGHFMFDKDQNLEEFEVTEGSF
ncbi:MAG: 8-oxo-dGTP diphosphatase [Candidatus Daviesbacteria bacterium]|nr:8-oxo-dGTP diphosphatase [Candidatus Daviesbacteria bacterium]